MWETDTPAALNDLVEPADSNDTGIPRFTWWPHKASREWVQYDFDGEITVGKVAVYWFDDAPDGGCRIPAKWNLEYLQDTTWIPVTNLTDYTVALHRYNEVAFTPVSTKALRLVVRLQRNYSAGLLEWKVFESN